MPWEVSPLLYLDTHYERLGHERVFWIQKRVLASFARKVSYLARRYNIPPYIPLKWGGAGLFPPKKGWRYSSNEELWLRKLFSGDTIASRRMKAVRFGTVKMAVADNRAVMRTQPVFDKVIFTKDGQGLSPELDGLLAQVREFSEDIASAELRPTPEDVPVRTWFRSLNDYPLGGPDGSTDDPSLRPRTFRDVRGTVLEPDASKTPIESVKLAALRKLPQASPPPAEPKPAPVKKNRPGLKLSLAGR